MALGRRAETEQVSIHASRCREAMRRSFERSKASTAVSIHASRCREAMLTNAVIWC